jgi:hypothetical protein
MYCPQCRTEYREGFTECSDCHVPLLRGTPSRTSNNDVDPSLVLVEVLETRDAIQLAMARGLLEDAGIPFYLLGQITRLVNDVDPFLQKHVRIQVPLDREAEAQEILEMLLQPVTEDDGGTPGAKV